MSLGGSTVPFGAETSGLTELKVMGTGSKSFASGSLREVVGGTTPLSITDSWTWESWIWEELHTCNDGRLSGQAIWSTNVFYLSLESQHPAPSLASSTELEPMLYKELSCPTYFFWRRQWHPTPVLLPGKSHGWRSLEGCNPWGG